MAVYTTDALIRQLDKLITALPADTAKERIIAARRWL